MHALQWGVRVVTAFGRMVLMRDGRLKTVLQISRLPSLSPLPAAIWHYAIGAETWKPAQFVLV
ncbi:hypothetical protein [Stutzerimonas nosocomialis]|uniref:hypothetical protein n=1 Tax=Stutzerimonas nosocomialis TaxID=1056496 RepID=UPI0011096914|nr:hypothetical protein [Stutzerimonas nosocomialis]